ncbi:Glutamine synthetase [Sulfidibacter corallicola]|uniref:Glutamine synthetase n=1 Tax=Sulfidibacter corallicola TaxID=2818388 RepID=A0A8A4TU36_SULCO|nr:glutamine synthetase beta-grasp domain-containing protein [Sulfidibacter corallicola]QTD52611.1 glutamine synthetase beta-grasp domain-containing protein [Sulfidibacter corallicola]
MTNLKLAEYIWLDGAKPVRGLRSKAKVLNLPAADIITLDNFPQWSFDGSSTAQSEGISSDLYLEPVNFVKDPIRGEGNYLVLCEVLNADGTPHSSNSRASLRKVLDQGGAEYEAWAGFEQEYTLFLEGRPLGWPQAGFPGPQGPYYCGVGPDSVSGRELVEKHTQLCIDAGISIYGINAEVMPGQWEFQIGYRGLEDEDASLLNMADHLWLARWLLYRVGEDFGIQPSLDVKPVAGDWNGAGCHTNFSTRAMREAGGIEAIREAVALLGNKHNDHISVYGHGLERRLTGEHETCHINEFRSGTCDRGASIRIPLHVQAKGHGYFEDRRPGANCDPYLVAARILSTVTQLDQIDFSDWTLDAILSAGG